MSRFPLAITLAGVLALGACSSGSQRPGNPAVYDRIARETDCATLQHEFDTADANHARDIGRGALELADADTAYMQAADERMKAVGCP